MDPDNIQMFHENLKIIKNNCMSIKTELIKKQHRIENNIKENTYIIGRIKIIENIKDESNKILKNLKIQSDSIINDIIEESKKKYLNSIQIPELNASNIIFDLIDITLNNSIKSIIEEISVIYDDFGNFQKIINVEEKTSLDLIFILDVTSSMDPYLEQIKLNLFNIINRIILKCPGIDLNIGFIGFRDITHNVNYDNIEFTQNYENLKNSINNVYTSSGNDGNEEDIEEGFEMALKKNWKNNARIAILATDYPFHGKKYHSPKMGNAIFFPNGNPDRRNIEILVKELADKNISLFCMKITEYTDIMFDIFKTIYNNYENCTFKVIPLKSKEQLSNIIVDSSAEVYINQRNIY